MTERPAAAGAALAFGIVVALVWLEVFLRAGAAVYVRQMASSTGAFSRRDALKVLCVGDSFTFGIGAPTGESYPDRLERILNDRLRDGRAEVVNLGLPGKNSAEILWVVRKELNSPKIPPTCWSSPRASTISGIITGWHRWRAKTRWKDSTAPFPGCAFTAS
ncbi:MAG: hypothetical protein M5R36_25060 [Deltaproteobacteria bacterium]|nr:hypothetical protein [Deltaproteobacteria bacterium]